MPWTPWWSHQMETFSALLAICAGNTSVPVNSPHIGQWHGALMFSLIWVWINGWVNNGEAGDFRFHRAHYDVTVRRCCLSQSLSVKQFTVDNMNTMDTGFHTNMYICSLSCCVMLLHLYRQYLMDTHWDCLIMHKKSLQHYSSHTCICIMYIYNVYIYICISIQRNLWQCVPKPHMGGHAPEFNDESNTWSLIMWNIPRHMLTFCALLSFVVVLNRLVKSLSVGNILLILGGITRLAQCQESYHQ